MIQLIISHNLFENKLLEMFNMLIGILLGPKDFLMSNASTMSNNSCGVEGVKKDVLFTFMLSI